MGIGDFFATLFHILNAGPKPGVPTPGPLPYQIPTPGPTIAPAPADFNLSTVDNVKAVQARLSELGYLDPPADGGWGGASKWALQAFCKDHSVPFVVDAPVFDPAAVLALRTATPLPIKPGADLASRLIRTMQKQGLWIARHPDCLNIIYADGMNKDGTLNKDDPNQFNDLRSLVRINADGVPILVGAWDATTSPGRYWTVNPMSSDGYLESVPANERRPGAFHIDLGQQKAWTMGTYHTQEALVQARPIHGTRDPDCTMRRDPRHPVYGEFGVHHHWGYNLPKTDLGNSSAGCLVGQLTVGHMEFISHLKGDARRVGNSGYVYMATVLAGTDVLA